MTNNMNFESLFLCHLYLWVWLTGMVIVWYEVTINQNATWRDWHVVLDRNFNSLKLPPCVNTLSTNVFISLLGLGGQGLQKTLTLTLTQSFKPEPAFATNGNNYRIKCAVWHCNLFDIFCIVQISSLHTHTHTCRSAALCVCRRPAPQTPLFSCQWE